MKNIKKGILIVAIFATMPLIAAEDKTIYVNTFDDIDDENSQLCSLRMALKAAALNKAYGGCSAGNTTSSTQDTIQLEEGTYQLKNELVPSSTVAILGKAPQDYSKIDVITNDYPAKTALKTIIDGKNITRLINTSTSKATLSLTNIQLQNGKSTSRGGALYLGASTNLAGVSILNSSAEQGGAIYLEGTSSSLTLTSSVDSATNKATFAGNYQGNNATEGSVIAMSCGDNLNYSQHTIAMTNHSFIENGSNNSTSMISLCGQVTASLTGNTIAKNVANSTTGSIIKFTSDRYSNADSSKLSNSSSLALLSNTIVENNAFTSLLYDKTGAKSLSFNILAFNTQRSCRYALGEAKDLKDANIGLSYNALSLSSSNTSQCDVPSEVISADHTVDVSNIAMSSVLSSLQTPSEYTSFQYLYFPLNNSSLVDTGAEGCSSTDQRGISRLTDGTLLLNPTSRNTCDIGSTEILHLTAGDISDLSNTSFITLLNSYQTQLDAYKTLVGQSDTSADLIPFYNVRIKEYEALIAGINAHKKYRAIYVNPFAYSLPEEKVTVDGGREIQHLTTDNYTVTATPLGVGMITGSGDNAKLNYSSDDRLKCEWLPDLKRIIIYRTDDGITQAGDYNFCQYTLTQKNTTASTAKQSSGVMQASFVNINPIAKAAEYTIQYGTDQKISVNLLSNASDEGDGPVSTLLSNPNKATFYHDASGVELPIQLIDVPSTISVSAERSGACPYPYQAKTCYGGLLTVQVKNTFNLFNYSFDYVVYDADGGQSDQVTVTLKNSAATTNNDSGGGGGSFDFWTILALLGLIGYRQYKR